MSIRIAEIESGDKIEITIRNRSAGISVALLSYLILTYGNLVSALMFSVSDFPKNILSSLWSIFLNGVSSVLFTHIVFYFSIYRSTFARVGGCLRIVSFGLWPVLRVTKVQLSEVKDVIFAKTQSTFTAEDSLTVTLFIKDSKKRSHTFTVPR